MKKNITVNTYIFNKRNAKNAKVISVGYPKPSIKPNLKPICSDNK